MSAMGSTLGCNGRLPTRQEWVESGRLLFGQAAQRLGQNENVLCPVEQAYRQRAENKNEISRTCGDTVPEPVERPKHGCEHDGADCQQEYESRPLGISVENSFTRHHNVPPFRRFGVRSVTGQTLTDR
jgi:hypothetical protein